MSRKLLVWGLFLLLLPLLDFTSAKAQVFDKVIDKNGTGDFRTIQDAINAVPSNSEKRTLIFVKEGIYNEKVVLSPAKTNVSLIGESPGSVVFSWDDYSGKNGLSTANSYTFWADANGFYAENITFRNTAGAVGQAVAIRTTGDSMVFRNCRFLGFQDTYYAHKKRQYNLNCHVEGGTDFIFGDATSVFDSCTIHCLKGGQYISAPADAKTVTTVTGGSVLHGLLFRNCRITAASGVGSNSYYLGRPWQPASSSVFISCILGPHIKPAGWSAWSGDNHLSSFFAEYNSTDNEGKPVDVSGRVTWSKQLTGFEASTYYILPFFFKKDGKTWNAEAVTKELPAPRSLWVKDRDLSWEPVENAVGYVVYSSGKTIGFSKGTSYTLDSIPKAGAVFELKAVSRYGALGKSAKAVIYVTSELKIAGMPGLISPEGHIVVFTEPVKYEIFSITGRLILKGTGLRVSLTGLTKGTYIVKAQAGNGRAETMKIIL